MRAYTLSYVLVAVPLPCKPGIHIAFPKNACTKTPVRPKVHISRQKPIGSSPSLKSFMYVVVHAQACSCKLLVRICQDVRSFWRKLGSFVLQQLFACGRGHGREAVPVDGSLDAVSLPHLRGKWRRRGRARCCGLWKGGAGSS